MNTDILKKSLFPLLLHSDGVDLVQMNDVLYSCRANHLLLNSLDNLQYKDKHFHINKSLKIGTNWTS